jgi:hypothetical protein
MQGIGIRNQTLCTPYMELTLQIAPALQTYSLVRLRATLHMYKERSIAHVQGKVNCTRLADPQSCCTRYAIIKTCVGFVRVRLCCNAVLSLTECSSVGIIPSHRGGYGCASTATHTRGGGGLEAREAVAKASSIRRQKLDWVPRSLWLQSVGKSRAAGARIGDWRTTLRKASITCCSCLQCCYWALRVLLLARH